MSSPSPVPKSLSTDYKNQNFFKELKSAIGLEEPTTWHNNNSTMVYHGVYVKYIDSDDQAQQIISNLFALKKKYDNQTFCAVPTAGCKPIKTIPLSGVLGSAERKKRMDEEYRKSFSLSPNATGKYDLYLIRSLDAQKMKIVDWDNLKVLKVTPDVRITDADGFLETKKLALVPNQPTIHVISFGGFGTGPYGPAKDLPSVTTNILRMKVITPLGERLTLSDKEHPKLFHIFRDTHLGVFNLRKLYMRVVPEFNVERHDQFFKDVKSLRAKMMWDNLIDKDHFIGMYLPACLKSDGDHFPRFRITNFRPTNEPISKNVDNDQQQLISDYTDLLETEAGEKVIDRVTKNENLQKYFDFIIDAAAYKTYGIAKDFIQVIPSKDMHILHTYTSLPIKDYNWLIQVDSVSQARDIFLGLFDLTEKMVARFAKDDKFPLLNGFCRYIKGLYYPKGEGTIACTGVEKEGQDILSFEYVTYEALTRTKEFKQMVKSVQAYLKDQKVKVKFHPGKHAPDGIYSLTQTFTGEILEQRLKNFQDGVLRLHGPVKNIDKEQQSEAEVLEMKENFKHSTLLSAHKKSYIGMGEDGSTASDVPHEEIVTDVFTKKQEGKTLVHLLEHAKKNEDLHASTIKAVTEHLANLT